VLWGEKELDASEVLVSRNRLGGWEATVQRAGAYTVKFEDGRSARFHIDGLPEPVHIDGDWQVTFPPPEGPIGETFSRLIPWLEHDNERIRDFTGTATYRKTVVIPGDHFNVGRRLILELGTVGVMARVVINGKLINTLWKPPFELDITDTVKAGENTLEIGVTNVQGDKASGLIGPVTVRSVAVAQAGERAK